MAARDRVVIIGGGVIGVCSAYYLARQGRPVTLLEQGEICAGSSYGNAGLIVPSHSVPLAAPGVLWKGLKWMLNPESPFYIKPRLDRDLLGWLWRFAAACRTSRMRRAIPIIRDLSRASLALYRELAALDGFEFGYQERGALGVYVTEHGYADGRAEARLLEEAGLPAKVLDGPAARSVEPALSAEVVGAVYFAEDAHLIPDRFVTGLARIAAGLGATVRTGTEVLGFTTGGRRIAAVETTRGTVEAGEVVLAAGSWSPGIARGLRLRLPIQPAKGYSLTCRRPPDSPAIPLLLGEAKVGVTPMADTLRFAGTLELAGLDLAINRRRVDAIRRSAVRYLRAAANVEVLEIWRGLRPCTPDGLPIIGRPAHLDNLIVATGHAMIGVSLGPVTGRLVSQLAGGERPLFDLAPLSPERFA
jgi:D-amino-acid dehydrogenase